MIRQTPTSNLGPRYRSLLALVLPGLLLLVDSRQPAVAATQQRITARWIGQDEKDLVGPRSDPGPSDVQDIHIKLDGLPPNRPVKSLVIRGDGGDEWQYNGKYGPYRAELVQEPGQSRADLYVEPTRTETGRSFSINFTFENGQTTEIFFKGGRADPNLRMPQARLGAKWLGQPGHDRAGLGPAVGPDGYHDAAIGLDRLSSGIEIRKVTIRARDGTAWETGVNPDANHAAWLIRDAGDATRASLYFQPDQKRGKESLEITVHYGNDKTDSAKLDAGPMNPAVAVKSPEPTKLAALDLKSNWGSQSTDPSTLGYVQVTLDNLPGKVVAAAALSDPAGEVWVYRGQGGDQFEAASYPLPLVWKAGPGRSQATLMFPPVRDETDTKLDLRIRFNDGREALATINGGPANLALRSAKPDSRSIVAKPGDNLAQLVNSAGTIKLSAGSYALNAPLVLNRAVTINAEPGATLEFSQPGDAPAWTAAIKIHAGQTTLEGFRVRFTGPVRWDRDVSYGPAVIGTTDNRDPANPDPIAGLALRNLEIEAPPATSDWEEAPRTMRLVNASSGQIVKNTIRGGAIELKGGPWLIEGNTHLGTPPGMFAFSIISAHRTHDMLVRNNKSRANGPSGKTWRFLVLTVGGWRDEVRDNVIEDVGPRDSDSRTENAPEIILTEAYRLRYEGVPAALSPDRRVLMIPDPQGDAGEPGDMVAILAGKHAGTYRKVVQRINRTSYLLDTPLPPMDEVPALSVCAQGFSKMRFEGNKIDGRGSRQAAGFVLAGNHYGTRVIGNTIFGCGEGIRVISYPTEQPGPWGWSHMPMFGIDVNGNRLESPRNGLTLAVEHGPPIATNKGRLYYSGWLRDNTIVPAAGSGKPPQFVVGDARAIDKNELVLSIGRNRLEGGPPGAEAVRVENGVTYPIKEEK